MQLARLRLQSGETGVGKLEGDAVSLLALNARLPSLSAILEADDPRSAAESLLGSQAKRLPLAGVQLLAPIDRQEVWAAGVTYRRSRTARMEESEGAASFYDKVYVAARP